MMVVQSVNKKLFFFSTKQNASIWKKSQLARNVIQVQTTDNDILRGCLGSIR